MTITGYAPTQPIVITIWTPYFTNAGPVERVTRYPRRSYRRLKKWCPPPPPPELVALPMLETAPASRPWGVAWLAHVAKTPGRERRPIRDRVERKDAQMGWS
jgi:hypothetical protein